MKCYSLHFGVSFIVLCGFELSQCLRLLLMPPAFQQPKTNPDKFGSTSALILSFFSGLVGIPGFRLHFYLLGSFHLLTICREWLFGGAHIRHGQLRHMFLLGLTFACILSGFVVFWRGACILVDFH